MVGRTLDDKIDALLIGQARTSSEIKALDVAVHDHITQDNDNFRRLNSRMGDLAGSISRIQVTAEVSDKLATKAGKSRSFWVTIIAATAGVISVAFAVYKGWT